MSSSHATLGSSLRVAVQRAQTPILPVRDAASPTRRQLVFSATGPSLSPLMDAYLTLPGVEAHLEATSITSQGVSNLVQVTGPPASIQALVGLIDSIASPGCDLRVILHAPTQLAFFHHCSTPSNGAVQIEQLAAAVLGRGFSYRATAADGTVSVTVVAAAQAPLETFFRAARASLEPRFDVRLESLGPVTGPLDSDSALSLADEQVLLAAIGVGYFDAKRRGGVRDVARLVARPRSTTEDALRRAIGQLVRTDETGGHEATGATFEYWGSMPRSAHYAALFASRSLDARVESLNIEAHEAWQIVDVTGDRHELDALEDVVTAPAVAPIVAMQVLQREPNRLVYFDHWARPADPSSGVSLEHLLYDQCGPSARLALRLRHGVGRITAHGERTGVEAFVTLAMRQLGERFHVARVPSACSTNPRARTALDVARQQGFFEVPRQAMLSDVARILDISAHTAGKLVRDGVRELVLRRVQGARRATGKSASDRAT